MEELAAEFEEANSVDRSWINTFVHRESDFIGYVGSTSELELLLLEFEISTNSHFIKQRKNNDFGKNPDLRQLDKLTIRWEDTQRNTHPPLKFDSVPFIILGSQSLSCHQGQNYANKKKTDEKMASSKKTDDEGHNYAKSFKKRRRQIQTTKKVGCNASVSIRHIVKFPDYKCHYGTKREKEIISKKLKEDLKKTEVQGQHQFHVELPEKHSETHLQGQIAGTVLPIDKELTSYIHQKVLEEQIFSTKEMQVLLKEFVINSFKQKGLRLPPRTNTRFWPTLQQIRNHMASAAMHCRDSVMDQTALERMVQSWRVAQPEDSFFLRLKDMENRESVDVNKHFLYIHQTAWQKDLLHKYGQELVLLDATYRTSKYAVPLFFMAVPTNVNYMVVAYFMSEVESLTAIKEALTIIRRWNVNWKPQYFITDHCEKEIGAIESTFSDCGTFVYLCDFHRLQAWNRWLTASIHGIESSRNSQLLSIMKAIGESYSEEELNLSIMNLMEQVEWKTNKWFQTWFQTNYLDKKERWVKLYRKERFNAINTTNGIERQNSSLKHGYLWNIGYTKNQTISQLAHIILQRYLPDCLKGYLRENAKASSSAREYSGNIPIFLHNRPTHFVQHVMQRWSEVDDLSVDEICDGQFFVQSATNPNLRYEVQLDVGNGQPSCQCLDWKRHHYPCKHLLSVIVGNNGITWESLPPAYRDSPFLTLDLSRQITIHDNTDDEQPVVDDLHVDEGHTSQESNIQLLQRNVRECSKAIDGLSYLCYDEKTLQACINALEKVRDDLRASCESDGGFLIEPHVQVPITSRLHGTLKARKGLKKSMHTNKRKLQVNHQVKKRRPAVLKSTRVLKRPNPDVQAHGDMKRVKQQHVKSQPIAAKKRVTFSDTVGQHPVSGQPTAAKKHVTFSNPVVQHPCTFVREDQNRNIILNVDGYMINQQSLDDLDNELPDEIMDAYLSVKTKEIQNRNIGYLTTANLTSIFSELIDPLDPFPSHGYLSKLNLEDYEILLGALCENNNHWCLMVIYPQSKTLLYINPLGEDGGTMDRYLRNWLLFLSERFNRGIDSREINSDWKILSKKHRKQLDSTSCGVFTLKFAEHVLTDGNFLFDSSKRSLQAMRHVIAQVLFDNSDKNLVSAPKPNQRRVIKPK